MCAYLLTDEEERRGRAALRQHVEHGRRSFGMWAVVEGERNGGPRDPAVDRKLLREPWHVCRQGRHEPVGSHATNERTSDAADGSAASARPGAGRDPSA